MKPKQSAKAREFGLNAERDSHNTLPDFSADWRIPAKDTPTAEIEARFYYEFARESQTILNIAEKLCHFSRGEIRRAQRRTLSYPGSRLDDLHPYCLTIVCALIPRINLREISWNELEPEQRENVIHAFSRQPAFRQLDELELINFAQERIYPSEPEQKRSEIDPRWHGSSRLYWDGIEEIAIRIDWNQGPQAIKAAMEQWFQRHKRGLARLKLGGKLPDSPHKSYMFHLRDDTGAKHPRQKYLTALRGLGAMRLLGSHTLLEAIAITKGSGRKGDSLFFGFVDARGPTGRSAWNRGITKARQTFHALFYRCDDYSLELRRRAGLPETEEPISYLRYRLRREK